MPQSGGDTMRGFEQAISKPRYHLTQFHRPAMLKEITVAVTHPRGLCASTMGFLPLWIFCYVYTGKEEPVMFDHQEELDHIWKILRRLSK